MSDEDKIKQWENLVYLICNKLNKNIKKTILEREDILSIGKMAVLEAYKTFDESKSIIKTHIYNTVYFAIRNEIKKHSHLSESQSNILMTMNKVCRELGDNATDKEIIARSNENNKSSALTLNSINFYKNIRKLHHIDITKISHKACGTEPSQNHLGKKMLLEKISKEMDLLPKEHKTILCMRWLEDKTHKEISTLLGFSAQKSSHIENKYKKLFSERFNVQDYLQG